MPTFERKLIKITALKVNSQNPRFEPAQNQREVISKMLDEQGDKLTKLSKDILDNGYFLPIFRRYTRKNRFILTDKRFSFGLGEKI